MTSERALFEQLASNLEYWTETAVESLSNPSAPAKWPENPDAFRAVSERLNDPDVRASFRTAIGEVLRGHLHSVLVALDGGSAMAETTTLALVDQNGKKLPEGLHELFLDYLAETDRL
jgi:hypothetical protein